MFVIFCYFLKKFAILVVLLYEKKKKYVIICFGDFMKVFFHTLGCKVNQYETQEMREQLNINGYEVTDNESDADIFVVNSCTVTSESDRKTRQCVRHYKKQYPESTVVLTGCMPQSFPEMAEKVSEYNRGLITSKELFDELLIAYETDKANYAKAIAYKLRYNEGFFTEFIKEIPDVEFTLDDASKEERINDFLTRIERKYKCFDLSNFISSNIDGFYDNEQ